MMSEIARQSQPNTLINPQYAEALEYAHGRNEFVWLAPSLARKAFKFLPKIFVVGVASGALVAATQGTENKGYADLNQADTEVTSTLVQFDKKTKFETAVAYFTQTMTAEKINYEVDVNVPIKGDIVPDCEGNKEMNGIGVLRFGLPFDAITSSRGTNGKTDLTVDSSKLTVVPHWEGAGPEFRDYTINSGGRNYDDRSGTCRSVTEGLAQAARIVNINGIANLMEDTQKNVEHDMSLKGLNVLTEKCAGDLDAPNKEAIREALVATVVKMGRIEDLNTDNITFTDNALTWNVEKFDAPKSVKVGFPGGDATSSYKFKDFQVDKVNCKVDPATIGKGGSS